MGLYLRLALILAILCYRRQRHRAGFFSAPRLAAGCVRRGVSAAMQPVGTYAGELAGDDLRLSSSSLGT